MVILFIKVTEPLLQASLAAKVMYRFYNELYSSKAAKQRFIIYNIKNLIV